MSEGGRLSRRGMIKWSGADGFGICLVVGLYNNRDFLLKKRIKIKRQLLYPIVV
jgi:hypothetical protein